MNGLRVFSFGKYQWTVVKIGHFNLYFLKMKFKKKYLRIVCS